MNDLISRQAAIEVADAVWSVTGDKNVAKVWDQLKDLPSAQLPTKITTATLSEKEQERTELLTEMALLKTYADGWNACLEEIEKSKPY